MVLRFLTVFEGNAVFFSSSKVGYVREFSKQKLCLINTALLWLAGN